jgi:hypothetical protein
VSDGKHLRDGLTHPSPYVNHDTEDPGKIIRIIGITIEQVQSLLSAAVRYVRAVEVGLGHDPSRSVPWLQSL